jgi:hypothetical protein
MGTYQTIFPDHCIVADMNRIIKLGTCSNNSIMSYTPVNGTAAPIST